MFLQLKGNYFFIRCNFDKKPSHVLIKILGTNVWSLKKQLSLGVLKISGKFTGKRLWGRPSLVKLQVKGLQLY